MEYLGYPKRVLTKKADHCFDIQWNALQFKHSTTMTQLNEEDSLLDSVDFASPRKSQRTKKTRNKYRLSRSRHSYRSLDIESPLVLGSSLYENRTDGPQTYRFSTQRETTTKLAVDLRESYSLGDATNIALSIPAKFLWDNKATSREVSLTKLDGEIFEETVSWKVETVVHVKAGHQAKAFFSVQEQIITAEFEVKTKVTLCQSYLPVIVRRKSDNAVVYCCFITNLNDVFHAHQTSNLCVKRFLDRKRVNYQLILFSRGVCQVRGCSDEEVIVRSGRLGREKC